MDRDENDNGLFRLSENISFFSDILKNSFDTSPNSAILSCLFYIQADSRSPFIRKFLISPNHINMKIGS
jgi:hypothetical protein